jgi:ABC-type proline/glycine betaine transport system ATPase subunit
VQKQELLDSLLGQVKGCVVGPDGGLISNLPVQENVILQAEFHGVGSDADREDRLNELMQLFGNEAAVLRTLWYARPARLTPFQKRLAGFMRAMLMEPQMMVFDLLFDGISRSHAAKAREFKRVFHLYFPFRHVVFVNYADEPLLQGLVGQTHHL